MAIQETDHWIELPPNIALAEFFLMTQHRPKAINREWQIQIPLMDGVQAIVKSNSLSIRTLDSGLFIPDDDYQRRRVSFKLDFTPTGLVFYHLDEKWHPDEYLNVDSGVDSDEKVTLELDDIRCIQYDPREHRFVIQVFPGVGKKEWEGYKEKTGLIYKGINVLPEPLKRLFKPPETFDFGGFTIVFQTEEPKTETFTEKVVWNVITATARNILARRETNPAAKMK